MQTYAIFAGSDEQHALKPASVSAATDYARLLIKCAPRPMAERMELCRVFGWDVSEATDEVFFEAYQQARAARLFPGAAAKIGQHPGALNAAEVGRAERDFMRATGLPTREEEPSSRDLIGFLTEITSNIEILETPTPTETPTT